MAKYYAKTLLTLGRYLTKTAFQVGKISKYFPLYDQN